ncbi:MAG: hypothetical protein K0S78_5546 [Thermomicrobiales bacterium]|nr:hypothetical protein [Thermomicrobiales bacterium]
MPAAVWPITCRRLTNRAELGNQPVTDVEGRKVHRLSLIVAMLALLLSGPAGIAAQDSTPEASGSALAALGYPELLVRVDGDAFEMPETTVPAGRTLVRLENVGEESWHGFMLQVPEDVTDEQVVADLGPDAESPPPWLFEAIYPGFPGETLPGQTNLALVDLSPGRYIVLGDTVQQFEVVGDAATPGATPEAERSVVDGTVRLFDFNFEFPDTVAAGRQLWEVTNTGEQPHELLLARSPEPVTAEQVMELMAGESEEATPTGGGPSFANFEPVGGIGWLSPGLTALTEVDLEPGTYVALCFVFDPETGLPHVALGMVAVFTVGEGTATPVA